MAMRPPLILINLYFADRDDALPKRHTGFLSKYGKHGANDVNVNEPNHRKSAGWYHTIGIEDARTADEACAFWLKSWFDMTKGDHRSRKPADGSYPVEALRARSLRPTTKGRTKGVYHATDRCMFDCWDTRPLKQVQGYEKSEQVRSRGPLRLRCHERQDSIRFGTRLSIRKYGSDEQDRPSKDKFRVVRKCWCVDPPMAKAPRSVSYEIEESRTEYKGYLRSIGLREDQTELYDEPRKPALKGRWIQAPKEQTTPASQVEIDDRNDLTPAYENTELTVENGVNAEFSGQGLEVLFRACQHLDAQELRNIEHRYSHLCSDDSSELDLNVELHLEESDSQTTSSSSDDNSMPIRWAEKRQRG